MDSIESDDKEIHEVDVTNNVQICTSLGEKFKTARNKMGKSILEVANHLHLAPQIIEALENDDYSQVASDVYAKGYLRTYAKFVQLPEIEVLEQYAALNLGKTIVKKQPQLITQKPPLIKPTQQRLITYSVIGFCLLGFIFWWSSGTSDNDDSPLLVLEEKKPVIVEKPLKKKKKIENVEKLVEEKTAENKEEKNEINIAAKEEIERLDQENENIPLILSPEDVLSG